MIYLNLKQLFSCSHGFATSLWSLYFEYMPFMDWLLDLSLLLWAKLWWNSKQAMAWPAPQKYAASQCSLLTLSEASSTLHLDTFHRATDASIFTSFQRLKFENVKIFIQETLILAFLYQVLLLGSADIFHLTCVCLPCN